ncbi:MAG: HAD-IB family phosphatase [Planctomycetota bacterium]|nr:HAD-IB family phosphatase [Planctomycetota bacterium]
MSLPKGWLGAKIVFFDCDSTLASIEGIDELAALRGADVAALTDAAMAGEIPLDAVFRKRLEIIAPTAANLDQVVSLYWQQRLLDAASTIAALQESGIHCHVISGGLLPAVAPFAERLGFDHSAIHAVPFPLTDQPLEQAIDIACAHPLARDGGKPEVIASVCAELGIAPQHAMLVGDGASDLEASAGIGLFVGFGGFVTRDKVRHESQVFLDQASLAPILPIALPR